MKKFFSSLFTESEQRVIFFILIFAFIGITARYTGLTAKNDPEGIDSLLIKEDVEIKFDLKTVTETELTSISGIGTKRASDILKYRNETGFKSRHDLLKIKGIGETSLKKIIDYFYEMEGDSLYSGSNIEANNPVTQINLNQASLEELCQLKGIGPAKAERIITLRNELGGFSIIDEVLEVKGIGPKTLDKMRDQIYLGE